MATHVPQTGVKMRIFSGIQPSGDLHLGNYLGAIRHWPKLQDHAPCIYCIVDLHAITVWQDPKALRASSIELTAGLIAAGIDPKESILFRQSDNPDHTTLAWLFNCIARVGWMNRMTQFKDKAGKNREKASLGLYAYPSLMAADILAHGATHVPVGEDQKQHLELTRDIALKFNHDYGVDFLPVIEPLIQGETTRVMSLRDGSKKMSKSDPSEFSRLNLLDDPDTLAEKIRKARTDSEALPSEIAGLEGRAEAENLLRIYAALAEQTLAETVQEFGGAEFSGFKKALMDIVLAKLAPISSEMRRLIAASDHIEELLEEGAERSRASSAPIIAQMREIIGVG